MATLRRRVNERLAVMAIIDMFFQEGNGPNILFGVCRSKDPFEYVTSESVPSKH